MTFGGTIARALLTGSVAWLAFGSPGFAGDLSQQQIIEQLMPHKSAPARDGEAADAQPHHRAGRRPRAGRAGLTRPWSTSCVTAATAR